MRLSGGGRALRDQHAAEPAGGRGRRRPEAKAAPAREAAADGGLAALARLLGVAAAGVVREDAVPQENQKRGV